MREHICAKMKKASNEFYLNFPKVLPTERKGNGAFASKPISKGTYLGDYEGELLTETAYWTRYPDGVVKYFYLLSIACLLTASLIKVSLMQFNTIQYNNLTQHRPRSFYMLRLPG